MQVANTTMAKTVSIEKRLSPIFSIEALLDETRPLGESVCG